MGGSVSLLVIVFENCPQPGQMTFPPQWDTLTRDSGIPPAPRKSLTAPWELLETLCRRVEHTLAQGSENTDFILQNDTNKQSNNQEGTLWDSVAPTVYREQSSQFLTAIKFVPFSVCGSRWVGEGCRKIPFLVQSEHSNSLSIFLVFLISSKKTSKALRSALEAFFLLHCFPLQLKPTSFTIFDVLYCNHLCVVSVLSGGGWGGSCVSQGLTPCLASLGVPQILAKELKSKWTRGRGQMRFSLGHLTDKGFHRDYLNDG